MPIGNGSFKDAATAVQIGTATNWIKIVAGGVNTAGIQSDGSLWVWGANLSVGNTTPLSTNNLLIPTLLSDETNWVDAVVDYNIGFSIKSDGTLWAWGMTRKYLSKPTTIQLFRLVSAQIAIGKLAQAAVVVGTIFY